MQFLHKCAKICLILIGEGNIILHINAPLVQSIYGFAVNMKVNMTISSSNTSRLEDHPGIYRLLMKGIFDAYVL